MKLAEVGPDPDYRSRLWQDSAFSFGSGPGVKNLGKTGPGPGVTFSISAEAGVCVVIS